MNHVLLLTLDLVGTFAFALNGALAAIRAQRLDVVGVLTLGVITAIGGGILRDLVIGATPPPGFSDWRYLTVAAAGGIVVFLFGHKMSRLTLPITIVDSAGLGLFAVTGTAKAMAFGLGPIQAALLGVTTAVGGGTLRDVILRRPAAILTGELYAIPALLAAVITASAIELGIYGVAAAVLAAMSCFTWRMLAVHFGWNAPHPRGLGAGGASGAGGTGEASGSSGLTRPGEGREAGTGGVDEGTERP